MKTIVYILMVFLSYTMNSQTTDELISVSLGRLGEDCKGRGICSFENVATKDANAILSYQKNNATLSFLIHKLTDAEIITLIGTPKSTEQNTDFYFQITEAFIVSSRRKSETNTLMQIPSGNYKVTVSEHTISITIPLKQAP